nr:hypothetical protein [Tanacetum cinerariifolium]
MSDNIPFEIQTEIIKRAPDVKSLVRFRSVSKPWKSFIESSEFIAGYRAHLAPNVSALLKQQNDTLVIGYSRGLLCLFAFVNGGRFSGGTEMLVLWNPSLRRSVGILKSGYFGVFGFAVCPVTNEPTIVKFSFPWKVHIFTLSSNKWTEIQCSKPRKSITHHEGSHVVIGSCIYRVPYETICLPNGYFTDQYMIVSFDVIAKEFKAIDLPDKITTPFTSPVRFILSKLKGSLVVIVPHREVKVWKMEPDCSFTQLLTINTPDICISNIVGFRKNGDLLVETEERRGQLEFYGEARESALEIYNPCSQHMSNLGFSGQNGSFFVRSYKETLHLLDHSDSCVYPENLGDDGHIASFLCTKLAYLCHGKS